MRPTRTYVVCSTPRSGSTLLCELLKSTGVAGIPEEYFEGRLGTGLPPHPGEYLQGLPRTGAGIRDDPTPPYAPRYSDLRGLQSYREHLERTFRLGTTPNGVFGAKIMWRQLADLQAHAGGLPEYSGLGLPQLFDRLLGGPTYVWMRRCDKVRQAISMWRALQTRIWRLEHRRAEDQSPELHYSFRGIDHLTRALRTDDEGWERYFARNRLAPLTIFYEQDLDADPAATTERVLAHIGIVLPTTWRPSAPTARQADRLSDEWLAAYHRDATKQLVRG